MYDPYGPRETGPYEPKRSLPTYCNTPGCWTEVDPEYGETICDACRKERDKAIENEEAERIREGN